MFAVLKTGGKQYRVKAGDMLRVGETRCRGRRRDSIQRSPDGGANVGTPLVEGAAVQAEVVDQIKGEKVINLFAVAARVPRSAQWVIASN